MEINQWVPVNFQVNLKILDRWIKVDAIGVSAASILLRTDPNIEEIKETEVLISGDFSLQAKARFDCWIDISTDSDPTKKNALFQILRLAPDEEQTWKRLIEYYQRLRKAGVYWADFSDRRARAL